MSDTANESWTSLNGYLLLLEDKQEEQTSSGIYLSTTNKREEIVSTGVVVSSSDTTEEKSPVNVGDRVLFDVRRSVLLEGMSNKDAKLRAIKFTDVLAVNK